MALSDYWKGPEHRRRADDLDLQLTDLQARYQQLQALTRQIGAMEVVEVKNLIAQEKRKLAAVHQEVQRAEQDAAALAQRSSDLQREILVWEETLLLESFALYEPKFKLNSSHEYKARLVGVREQQKALIKSGTAASGNTNWEVNGSKVEGRKLVNDMIKLVLCSLRTAMAGGTRKKSLDAGAEHIRPACSAC